jgi:hypothetical protein
MSPSRLASSTPISSMNMTLYFGLLRELRISAICSSVTPCVV